MITETARRLLLLAAVVVVLEALAYASLAVLNLRDAGSERLLSGIGVAVLLGGFGIAQVIAVRLLLRGNSTARSPLVVAHLLQLLVATNLRDTPAVAIPIGAAAVVVLACVMSPPVTRALASDVG